ncbi:MAG TPA: hypothetical protein VF804_11130 [Holophagaceae bacterium]
MPTGRSLLRGCLRGSAACLLGLAVASGPLLRADDPPAKPAVARDLGDAFQKGPIGLQAEVIRKGARLPLFQVPVLRYEDRVEVSLSGEAFDPRVTQADWTLVVVFLPRTVAPTERGVVELRLKRKGEAMVAAPFTAPYDAIPMFFLVPDTGGRRKILTDLSAHLEAFRSICLKLSDLTEQRANADRFFASLDTIRKDQSPASYDAAVYNFLKAYGGPLSQDFQVFLARNDASNLEKFQFLTQEFTRTNLLSPTAGDGSVSLQGQSVSGPLRPASAYVAIAFDLVQIFQNLWPGHQFQYVPALARDFDGPRAQLWYGDWIHTTGEVRGALVFSPCRWTDADPPAFTFDLPADGSLLQPFGRLQVHPKAKSNLPFALYGHGWHLVLDAPKDGPLAPLPLTPSPDRQSFILAAGPAQDALRARNLLGVKARIEGQWGFDPVSTPAVELPAGLDPAWKPSEAERARFMVGEACAFRLPAPWAACVGRLVFHPAQATGSTLEAELKVQLDGSRLAAFKAPQGPAGLGTLDLFPSGGGQPALRVPVALLPPLPVVDHVEVHQGENALRVVGSHLQEASACVLAGVTFAPGQRTPEGWTFLNAQKPVPGEAGDLLQGELRLGDDRVLSLKDVPLLPPRPQIGPVQVIPEHAPKGLPLSADRPLIPPDAPVMISVLPGRKGAYPFGRKPQILLRSSEDPATARPVPPQHLRMVGRGQRLLATLKLSDLFGAAGAGHLELQVSDAKAGASAWVPLQPLFLELPEVEAVHLEGTSARLEGPVLETIEAVAPAPGGPWTPFGFGFQDGLETGPAPAPAADGALFLRLYGWPDLVVRLQGPVPPKAVAPAPAPSVALPAAPQVAPVKGPEAPKSPTVEVPRAPAAPVPAKGGLSQAL